MPTPRHPIALYLLIGFIVLGGFLFLIFAKGAPKAEAPSVQACTLEALICPDGSTVGRVGPNCEFAPCPQANTGATSDPRITLDTPVEGDTITSPVTLSGKVRGNWYFEASFPIIIVDWDGRIIGEGHATAQGDWMTTEFVPFTATVHYTVDPQTPYARGAIILKKDNPSGLPENDAAIEIPVILGEIANAHLIPGNDVDMEYPIID